MVGLSSSKGSNRVHGGRLWCLPDWPPSRASEWGELAQPTEVYLSGTSPEGAVTRCKCSFNFNVAAVQRCLLSTGRAWPLPHPSGGEVKAAKTSVWRQGNPPVSHASGGKDWKVVAAQVRGFSQILASLEQQQPTQMTAAGFEPAPSRTNVCHQRLRPLSQTVLKVCASCAGTDVGGGGVGVGGRRKPQPQPPQSPTQSPTQPAPFNSWPSPKPQPAPPETCGSRQVFVSPRTFMKATEGGLEPP